jgi:hypothetical protein
MLGSHLLCRPRPSTAPHEAFHRHSIPSARVAVQSLGARYSSPSGAYMVISHGVGGLCHRPVCRSLLCAGWMVRSGVWPRGTPLGVRRMPEAIRAEVVAPLGV